MAANFKEIQLQLAQQIRTGDSSTRFESRRLEIYQSLFYNNIEGFCATAFPVLKSILGSEIWALWVRAFFVETNNHSPFFSDIAEQFLSFLNEQSSKTSPVLQEQSSQELRKPSDSHQVSEGIEGPRELSKTSPFELLISKPWLLELAHYEWAELHVSLQEGVELSSKARHFIENPMLLNSERFSVSPSAMPLAYQHPVQTISAENANEVSPTLTTLIVHQPPVVNNADGEDTATVDIKFVQTDVLTIHLLSFLQQKASNTESNEVEVSGHSLDDMFEFLTSPSIGLESSQAEEYLQKALPDLVERGVLIIE